MDERQAFETLGWITERLTDVGGFAADLDDDTFSVALANAQAAVMSAGSRLAQMRRLAA